MDEILPIRRKTLSNQTINNQPINQNDSCFTENHGARPGVAKYVIVLTDGRSNDNSRTVQAATALHKVPNVTVIAIGIGHAIDRNELHIIGTDNNHTFVVNNFDLLHTLEVELVDKTCKRELPFFDFSSLLRLSHLVPIFVFGGWMSMCLSHCLSIQVGQIVYLSSSLIIIQNTFFTL